MHSYVCGLELDQLVLKLHDTQVLIPRLIGQAYRPVLFLRESSLQVRLFVAQVVLLVAEVFDLLHLLDCVGSTALRALMPHRFIARVDWA